MEWTKMRIEAGEFGTAPVRHRIGKLPSEIAEEQERARCREVLSHEKKGRLWGKEHARRQGAKEIRIGKCGDAIAERAIADLVMVLGKRHERHGWKLCALLATRRAAAVR